MNSLKAVEKPLAALSHETRLGMAVITILFCAFCFLVYHKMDLHEKQRQLASIQPNGTQSGDSTGSAPTPESDDRTLVAGASSATGSENSEVVDPLISRADLSSGSPFADDPVSATGEQTSGIQDQQPVGSLSEPATDSVPIGTSSGEEPPVLTDSAEPAFVMSNQSGSQQATINSGVPATEEPALLAAETSTSPTAVSESSEASSFGFSEPSSSTAESTHEATTDTAEPAFAAIDESASSTESTQMPEPAVSPLSVDTATSTASKNAASDPVSSEPTENREPVLLAMAEPQSQDGISGGFSSDGFTSDEASTGITPGRAPASEPDEPFSGFNSEPTASSQPKQSVSNETPFGGGGFNAVTQPGTRRSGNSIRTAAGSGAEADGKFSLAAFNYQNTNVEPAPDDGSTFDAVKVQNGDNYSKISKRVYGTTRFFSALAVFNQHRIPEPKNMRPGMFVLTPPAELLEERYPQLFEDMKPRVPEPPEFLELEDGSPAYRVGERETLSEISQRFLGRSSRWIEIYRMNQNIVQDPNRLKPGIILALPADAIEVHIAP